MVGDKPLPNPGELFDEELVLILRQKTARVPERGWVPAYHFTIALADSRAAIGVLSLRVGSNESLRLYAGHIGYAIDEAHRGRRYAARAMRLIVPLARSLELDPLWITCDPENAASRRTCELAGAEFVETVAVPQSHEMYAQGARFRCRYRMASNVSPPDSESQGN